MAHRIIVKQTPMGAFHWQMIEVKSYDILVTSKDFETRDQALEAVSKIETLWPEAYSNLIDQTPEGRKIANAKKD